MMTPSTTTREPRGIVVRPAAPNDTDLVLGLIRDLAAYENLSSAVDATASDIEAALFADQPRVFCDIVERNGEAAGFALWFYSFSTFRGRHGLYLEDLFVRPEARGHGLGKALMQSLARRCVREDLARFEWSVLDWNAPSIGFYQALGATLMDGWTTCRLTDGALAAVAAGA